MALPDKIKVCAVEGVLVPVPKLFGNVAQYVGRRLDYAAIEANSTQRVGDDHKVLKNLDDCYPIDDMNSEFGAANGVQVLNEIRRAVVHGDLKPANELTARWCGVKIPAPVTALTPEPVTVLEIEDDK